MEPSCDIFALEKGAIRILKNDKKQVLQNNGKSIWFEASRLLQEERFGSAGVQSASERLFVKTASKGGTPTRQSLPELWGDFTRRSCSPDCQHQPTRAPKTVVPDIVKYMKTGDAFWGTFSVQDKIAHLRHF